MVGPGHGIRAVSAPSLLDRRATGAPRQDRACLRAISRSDCDFFYATSLNSMKRRDCCPPLFRWPWSRERRQ